MPLRYNGVNSNSCSSSDFVEGRHKANSFEDSEKASTKVFKGFEKIPAIVVQRLDVTPYLNGSNHQIKLKTGENIEAFFSKCSVRVIKEDLLQLKRCLTRRSLDSDSQSVDLHPKRTLNRTSLDSDSQSVDLNPKQTFTKSSLDSDSLKQSFTISSVDSDGQIVNLHPKQTLTRSSLDSENQIVDLNRKKSLTKSSLDSNSQSMNLHPKRSLTESSLDSDSPKRSLTRTSLDSDSPKRSLTGSSLDSDSPKRSLTRCSLDSDSQSVDSNLNMVNLKCKICNKIYSSEKKLQNHQENKHMLVYKPQTAKPQKRVSFSDKVIIHEVKEYHKCRKCPKIFENYKSLKVHMKLRHKKRKCYICNYCNKNFVDRMFFKVHIRLHCDICSLLLRNKTKYLEHRRYVCRVLKMHKCKTCDSAFFKFMDLKDHSYEHTGTYYICDICKDQCHSKCAIAHHISYLHSNQRPTSLYLMRNLGTERLYLCNFCDESSVDRDLIENHIQSLPDLKNRVMTGYKDYYFCDHCFRKFATEKEMLQHKWTHFLTISDNSLLKSILTNNKKETKRVYKVDEEIPDHMKPKVVLEKIKVGGREVTQTIDFVNINSFDVNSGEIKKPVVDPKSKKTLISKHQCENCGKYYSSNYCLNRHIETQHSDFDTLKCKVCEETFVWPSLLKSHKCIRSNIPELPFDDARPEIHFDNLHEITENGFDDFNIDASDDYMNAVDFEIPAPIVELKEYDSFGDSPLNLGYKLVMQEVPIEF